MVQYISQAQILPQKITKHNELVHTKKIQSFIALPKVSTKILGSNCDFHAQKQKQSTRCQLVYVS